MLEVKFTNALCVREQEHAVDSSFERKKCSFVEKNCLRIIEMQV